MDFESAATENNDMLLTAYQQYASIEDFLHADLVIPMHSMCIEDPREVSCLEFDLDGLVIELDHLSGVVARIHYLRLPVYNSSNVKPNWPRLNKHFRTMGLDPKVLEFLKCAHGVTLAKVDGGYFLNVTFVPHSVREANPAMETAAFAKVRTIEALNAVVQLNKEKLQQLPDNMNILPQDQGFMLDLLDSCFQEATGHHLRPIFTVQKY